jgi:hypothetical protein
VPFYDAVELIHPTIALGTNILSDLAGFGVFNDSVELDYEDIDPGNPCLSDLGSVGVNNDGMDVAYPAIQFGDVYQSVGGPGIFDTVCTELWFYAQNYNDQGITVEARIDPVTGPYVSTFYPAFFIVVGKLLDFEGVPRFGRAPLTVQFNDLSSPLISNWFWTFGDGGYSIEQNPQHVYQIPGVYDVRMRVRIGVSWYDCLKRRYIVVWPGGLKVAETNRCLSFAVEPSQGRYWREFGGAGWVFPESLVGTFEVFTTDDQPITCITDARTGKTYRLATREGPTDSGIHKRYLDRYGDAGYGGTEIPWVIRFPELTAPEESELLKHLISYFNFRPQLETNKGAAGYDSAGYRDAQEIALVIYRDGDTIRANITRKIPLKGAITFDDQIAANRIQMELQGTAGELRLTEMRTSAEMMDQRVAPNLRLMSHHDYQGEMSRPLFRISRGKNPLINLAKGTQVTGSVFGYTTGPDQVSGSAPIFTATSALTDTFADVLSGDLTIMAWASAITAGTVEICRIGNLVISVQVVAGLYLAVINDNGTIYTRVLSWSGSGWVSLKITRSGTSWIVGENGSHIHTFPGITVNSYSGSFAMIAGNPKYVFDVQLFNRAISEEAYYYNYENIMEKQGKAVLPIV